MTAASKRSKICTLKWLQRTESASSVTELESPGSRRYDLDTVLADAVMVVAKGTLKRDLTLYSEERTRVGRPLAGRAALWHVYARFKLDRGMAMGIDFSTLVQLTFSGCLETFLSAWDYTFMGLVKQPDDDLLLCLLDTQLRKSKALGPAFVVYDGAQEGTKERSFQFL